jgi:hypothetical protein
VSSSTIICSHRRNNERTRPNCAKQTIVAPSRSSFLCNTAKLEQFHQDTNPLLILITELMNTVCMFVQTIALSWLLGLLIIGINMYFLSTSFVGWLLHNSLPKYANVLVGAMVFPLMVIYVLAIIYLTSRKDSVVTFVADSSEADTEKAKEAGEDNGVDDHPVPYRQDLADIPLPQ